MAPSHVPALAGLSVASPVFAMRVALVFTVAVLFSLVLVCVRSGVAVPSVPWLSESSGHAGAAGGLATLKLSASCLHNASEPLWSPSPSLRHVESRGRLPTSPKWRGLVSALQPSFPSSPLHQRTSRSAVLQRRRLRGGSPQRRQMKRDHFHRTLTRPGGNALGEPLWTLDWGTLDGLVWWLLDRLYRGLQMGRLATPSVLSAGRVEAHLQACLAQQIHPDFL